MTMKYQQISTCYLLCLFLFTFATQSFATHISGTELTYECISGCTYRVYVSIYRNCGGAPLTPADLNGFSFIPNPGCTDQPTAIGTWTLMSTEEVTPVCPSYLINTTCNGGTTIPGLERSVYYCDYDFCSVTCTEYTLQYDNCCRSGAASNLTNPSTYSRTITAGPLDPVSTICNQAPEFHETNNLNLCASQTNRFSVGAIDAEGDSLAYSLVSCLNVPYAPGYSSQQPFGSGWDVDLDGRTGNMVVTNQGGGIGTYNLCIQTDEYRNGALIATYNRDFLVTFLNCTNTPSYADIDTSITHQSHPTNTSFCIDIPALNPTHGFQITLTWSDNLTGATFTDTANTVVDTVIGFTPVARFCWTTPNTPGTYQFSIKLEDDQCPLLTRTYYDFVVDVYAPCNLVVDLGPDIVQCDDVILIATPALPPTLLHQWYFNGQPIPGAVNPSLNVSLNSSHGTGDYSVVCTDLATGCTATDTVHVELNGFLIGILTGLPVICFGGSAHVSLNGGGVGIYNYDWSSSIGGVFPNSPTLITDQEATYYCTITDPNTLCTQYIDFFLDVDSSAIVDIAQDTSRFCDPAFILPTITADMPYGNPANTIFMWSNGQSTQIATPSLSNAIYWVEAVDFNGCTWRDSTYVIITDLDVTATGDTLVCTGEPVDLDVTATGGNNYTYLWTSPAGGSVNDPNITNPTAVSMTTGYYTVSVESEGCVESDSVLVEVGDHCVWPGDADNDGIANNMDVLAIGIAHGTTGSARTNASLTWIGQPTTAWADTLPGGINYAYTDCDGNGTINDDDTLAISQNYGLIHARLEGIEAAATDPTLQFAIPTMNIIPGDTVNIPILLGTTTIPADSVYGVAFTINYDNTIVDSATVSLGYMNSWLGIPSLDLLSMQKDIFLDGEIHTGIVRTDQANRNGSGQIADITLVMIDDISGKQAILDTLSLSFSNVRIISLDGRIIPINLENLDVPITDGQTTSVENELLQQQFHVYPNPTRNHVHVSWSQEEADIRIRNIQGQLVREIKGVRNPQSIELETLGKGLYFIELRTEKAVAVKKIEVL